MYRISQRQEICYQILHIQTGKYIMSVKGQRFPLTACNFIKKRLQHRCFPVNVAKFLRTSILKNICERLLLKFISAMLKWNIKVISKNRLNLNPDVFAWSYIFKFRWKFLVRCKTSLHMQKSRFFLYLFFR